MSNYAVTLNYKCNYGYVEYNEATKTASVKLAVAGAIPACVWNGAFLWAWRMILLKRCWQRSILTADYLGQTLDVIVESLLFVYN